MCDVTTLSHRDMRNSSSEVLRRVAAGESFTITNHGRPVARLVPLESDVLDELAERGQLRVARSAWDTLAPAPASSGVTTAELLEDLRKPW